MYWINTGYSVKVRVINAQELQVPEMSVPWKATMRSKLVRKSSRCNGDQVTLELANATDRKDAEQTRPANIEPFALALTPGSKITDITEISASWRAWYHSKPNFETNYETDCIPCLRRISLRYAGAAKGTTTILFK